MARINTINELRAELKARGEDKNVECYGKFYIASMKFNSINEIDLSQNGEVFIGEHMLSSFEGAKSLVWLEENKYAGSYMTQRSCSLYHANVTENGEGNGYNDWYLFTTKEEAEDYINPSITLEINKNNAPEWLKELLKGNKINAIKVVRADLPTYPESNQSIPGLKVTKDFIEAFDNSIIKKG